MFIYVHFNLSLTNKVNSIKPLEFYEPCRNTERTCFRPISTKSDGLRFNWLRTKYILIRKCELHSSDICFFVLPRMLMLRSVLWVKKRNQLTFQYRTINVEFYAKQTLHTCCLSCFAELLSLSFRNFFNNVNLCYHSQIFQVQKTFMSSATVFYSVTMYRTKDVVL